jgi:hypothetical protein
MSESQVFPILWSARTDRVRPGPRNPRSTPVIRITRDPADAGRLRPAFSQHYKRYWGACNKERDEVSREGSGVPVQSGGMVSRTERNRLTISTVASSRFPGSDAHVPSRRRRRESRYVLTHAPLEESACPVPSRRCPLISRKEIGGAPSPIYGCCLSSR